MSSSRLTRGSTPPFLPLVRGGLGGVWIPASAGMTKRHLRGYYSPNSEDEDFGQYDNVYDGSTKGNSSYWGGVVGGAWFLLCGIVAITSLISWLLP